MRWPLKKQIFVRMLLLLLATIAVVTIANIRSTIVSSRADEEKRLAGIERLLRAAQFPFTSTVLENMKSLSEGEFLLQDANGVQISKTKDAPALQKFQSAVSVSGQDAAQRITVGQNHFLHSLVLTRSQNNSNQASSRLHIFLPVKSTASIWWQASRTPLAIAGLILPLALLFSFAMAGQVTRPLGLLQNQVQQIAGGNLQQASLPARDDEIRQLSQAVNDMASKIENQQTQLRHSERLQTMVQFGHSVAHHLRNSATGCRMAVELLSQNNRPVAESENYQVAIRQLEFMDRYIKKFMMLSKTSDAGNVQAVDLQKVLDEVIFLVTPTAKHLHVELCVQSDCDGTTIEMALEDAQQLMMNLVSNAIAAASANPSDLAKSKPAVDVNLQVKKGSVDFVVSDNGAGPPKAIAGKLFQPFVTGSAEGTGLGLYLVKTIADRMDATVCWERANQTTVFRFYLNKNQPLSDA